MVHIRVIRLNRIHRWSIRNRARGRIMKGTMRCIITWTRKCHSHVNGCDRAHRVTRSRSRTHMCNRIRTRVNSRMVRRCRNILSMCYKRITGLIACNSPIRITDLSCGGVSVYTCSLLVHVD